MESLFSILFLLVAVQAAWSTPLVDTTTIKTSVENRNVFVSRNLADNTTLRYVKDSGVCETTPGVHQLSGYIETGPNMSTVRILVYEKNKNVA